MQDFEKLGVFYLGKPYDPERRAPGEGYVLYDSKDLLTHAVCVGMTGSGKTGLCIGLLEEAAIDGIPALVIDPKGDLGNLLLTFPELRPADFQPYLADEARSSGKPVETLAQDRAAAWKAGIADWGQDGERIRKLRETVEINVFTPGSELGRPLSVLSSFDAPPEAIRQDAELFRQRVATTTSSLLALASVPAENARSREHVLVSMLLQTAWASGRS